LKGASAVQALKYKDQNKQKEAAQAAEGAGRAEAVEEVTPSQPEIGKND